MEKLEKIHHFIEEHHVMSLATSSKESLSVCSLFYAFEKSENTFIVASSEDTTHITQIKENANIAGNILLETKEIGKIQGLQFQGKFSRLEDSSLKKLYFYTFPYAIVLHPQLWKIKVDSFKFTDNRLGFGKKLIWP